MKKPKILVVGSINYDIIYQKIIEEGMNDNGMVFGHYTTANGGKGANQAKAASLMGADTYMVGCVGDDDYGYGQIAELKEAGVNTNYIYTHPELQTGLSVMLMRKNGTYIGANVLGANAALSPNLVKKALEQESFDLVMMQFEMPLETVYKTYEMASKKDLPVVLDPGPPKNVVLDRLKDIYLISPNEDETEALTGIKVQNEDDAIAASQVLIKKTNAKYVVLKLGSMGAYYHDGATGQLFPAYKVKAIDSTAAGDSFTAELAICLSSGLSSKVALKRANAAGAICVSRYGGQTSVPSAKEIEQFIRENR